MTNWNEKDETRQALIDYLKGRPREIIEDSQEIQIVNILKNEKGSITSVTYTTDGTDTTNTLSVVSINAISMVKIISGYFKENPEIYGTCALNSDDKSGYVTTYKKWNREEYLPLFFIIDIFDNFNNLCIISID